MKFGNKIILNFKRIHNHFHTIPFLDYKCNIQKLKYNLIKTGFRDINKKYLQIYWGKNVIVRWIKPDNKSIVLLVTLYNRPFDFWIFFLKVSFSVGVTCCPKVDIFQSARIMQRKIKYLLAPKCRAMAKYVMKIEPCCCSWQFKGKC